MNVDYSMKWVGNPSMKKYRFDIIGYLFGRELYRKTFWCDSKERGTIFSEYYIKDRVTNVACDQYRVEVFDGETVETVFGGEAPEKGDPWKADDAETLRSFPFDNIRFRSAANQAGWKERVGYKRARGKNMRVGKGAGRH